MTWNYRILAHEYKGEIYLQVHEVYYSKKSKPVKYTENAVSVGGETIGEILQVLKKMKKSWKNPILYAGDRFPNEYKI